MSKKKKKEVKRKISKKKNLSELKTMVEISFGKIPYKKTIKK